jgi:hypothetical protein
MSEYLHDAFHAVINDAKLPEKWYVSLMESTPYYGGPEEGGWWGSDTHLVAYREFSSEDSAESARNAVLNLAAELKADSHKTFGNQMLREMDWLDARGLEADWLPEPDGESDYYVVVSQGIPEESYGSRHYE